MHSAGAQCTGSLPFDDVIVTHMLSVRYISQKLGLAKHVLSCTSDSVDHIYDLNYFNIDITHTNHTANNTQHRIATISHCSSRQEERFLIESIPVIPAWVHRRVVHCLHGVSLWFDPHMWLTARHVCLSRPELSCPPAAKHGIRNWFDIRDYTHTLSLYVTYAWI